MQSEQEMQPVGREQSKPLLESPEASGGKAPSVEVARPVVVQDISKQSRMGSVLSTMKQIGFFSLACVHLYCAAKLAEPGSSLFSWHPVLTSAAFGLVMPEAFTQISRLSEFGSRFSYRSRITLHWVLQVTALLMAGVGLGCIVTNKFQNNRPHLKTFHSWFGLITFTYAVIQSVGGFLIMNPRFKPVGAPSQAKMKVYHSVSAAALMMLASAAMFISNYSLYMAKHKMSTTVYATGMWVYPGVLAARSLWTIYDTGAFGKLFGQTPAGEPRDSTL